VKAARFSQFGGPEVLEIVDLPDPHPGPGQIRIAVRAAGVNPSDWKKRKGLMDSGLPQAMGYEAAGAAARPAAIETATHALDQLGVGSGSTLLLNGASGSVGSAAVQLAAVRGARVIGTASPASHEYLRSLGGRAPPPTARASPGGCARSRAPRSTW
jgi:NADPH:quinone reductase-like Zn-dependent oxidoreductase